MTLPNFFIVGAAKSGTSSLYMYLKQHPDIFMSPVKEPHFFSFDNKSKYTNGPGDPIYKAITDLNKYEQLFYKVKNEKAIGEASTSYLYRPEAPVRINKMIPDAKIIAILRNPIERAFSAYMHVVRDQRETAKNFSEALALENSRINRDWEPIWHFTKVGMYNQQLLRYYQYFHKKQIRVFLYEELVQNKDVLLSDIFEFLNVDPDFRPASSVRFNVSGEQKSKLFYKLHFLLLNTPNPIQWFSRLIFPDIWRGNVANWIRQLNLTKKEISPETHKQLKNLYKDEINNLQELIGKDLSHWLEN
jgi:hypothetical protein